MTSDHTDPRTVTFRTKVDLWLIAVLTVSLGGGLVASVAAAATGGQGSWIPSLIMLGSILLVVVVSVPTEYTLSESGLEIRFGRFRRSIPFTAIRRVHPSRNPLSAPAWSLDRIAIHYHVGSRRGLALISPIRREDFLKLLRQRACLQESPRGLVPFSDLD